jgi:hypothetical protein
MVKKSQSASDFGLAWRLCVLASALIFPASSEFLNLFDLPAGMA